MATATPARLLVVICLAAPAAALAARSDWVAAEQSQLRLLVGGEAAHGRLRAGVEIVLEPGWYTYWRNPGEAGVPPRFDFSGSTNVAAVEVLYPAPERYDDGVSVSLIYRDEVVFPLLVTPAAPGSPVRLELDAEFGVCREVCIPTGAGAAVDVPASPDPDPLAEARVKRYEARLPQPPEPGRFDVESVTVAGDALDIAVRMPESGYADLFAEPPAGWYVGQPTFVAREGEVSRYRLPLAGKPPDAPIAGQTFRFVAVAGGEAIEEVVAVR